MQFSAFRKLPGYKFLAMRMEHLYIYLTSFSISQLCFMDFLLHLAIFFVSNWLFYDN